jgi:hypothetical protein
MLPDLKSFQGHSSNQIIARLNADGYQEIDSQVYRSADASHLLHLSNAPDLTAAFCRACQDGAPNEFLPVVYDHATISSDLHVSVTENMRCVSEFEANMHTTVFGHARAVSSMFEGDEMHADVHRFMASDDTMRDAMMRVVDCALDTKKSVTIDPCGNSIMFRHNENGCRTVFARPFVARDDLSPKECEKHLNWIKNRHSQAERDAAASPYWHG